MSDKKNENRTGLWIRESKDGVKYMYGKSKDGVKYTIFKNTYKTEDKHPDYNLLIDDSEAHSQPQPKPQPKASFLPKENNEGLAF